MVDDLRTVGAESLSALAAKLKATGNGGLRRELLKQIRTVAKPLIADARASAREKLPKAGGLNETIASSAIVSRTRLSGRNASVRITGRNHRHTRDIDRGIVKHPVYGNRHVKWPAQKVTPGWWTEPMEAGSPKVRDAIITAVRDVSRKL